MIALSVYAVIMAIHHYIEKYVEKEAFYISKANAINLDTQEIKFISTQKEEYYTFVMTAKSANGKENAFMATHSVTEFFDSYGYMHRQVVKEKLIDTFVAKLKKF